MKTLLKKYNPVDAWKALIEDLGVVIFDLCSCYFQVMRMAVKEASQGRCPAFACCEEAIHLILTGIGDETYSTVDACQTAQEMWEAIERLQQGKSLYIQDVKTNLFWKFGEFTSHDGETMESYYTRFYKLMNEMIRNNLTVATMQVNVQFLQQLQPEWSRFVTIVKQQHKLDEVSHHKLFDILKQYQKEVNELRAERLARNANPLALVATAQADHDPYYQTSRSHKPYAPSSKPSIPTRSHTTTRHKGKEIVKSITPPSETASEEDNDPEQPQRDKDMQKNLALIANYFKKIYKPTNNNLRTSSNSRNKNVNTTPPYKNDDHSGQFANQRRKPKRVKDSAYHKEKMLLCKQAEQGVPLQAEQYDWLEDTDEEVDKQELEAHYSYMAKIQEVPTADSSIDSEPVEKVQNDAGYNVFANELQHFEQSESVSNKCLVETDDSNVIPDSPDMCEDDIQNEQNDVESDDERVALANLIANLKLDTEFEKYKAFNDCTIDYDKLEWKLNETLSQLALKDIEIKEGLKTKAYELSVVKEKNDELMKQSLLTKSHYEGLVNQKTKVITDLKLREEHDIEKMLSMEKQLKLIPNGEETLALERESRSKLNKYSVRPYDYTTLNSLYEIFKPPTQEYEIQSTHTNEIRRKMWRKYFVKYKPNIYKNVGFLPVSKSISKSRQAYNVMTNNINHFKEIVDNAWIKHLKDQFRAPTTQDMEILIQTCLMPLAIKTQNDSLKFVHELKQEMHADLKYVEPLKKEIDELESDKVEFSNMYDVILQECVSQDVMCSYLMSLSDLDALDELQCLYLHKVKECDCLAQKLSNQTESVIWNEKASNVFRKEREQYIEIQDLKAKLQDKNIAISELKKLIEKGKGKSVDTKFDRPSVVRQPNAQRILKPLVLGKPTPFSNSLERIYFPKTMSVPKANVSEGLSKPVTAQTLPQTARQDVSNTNVLKPRMYRIDSRSTHIRAPQLPHTVRNTNLHVSTSTGVNHNTNVSRPQRKSNQSRDKVLPNNSQVKVKKTQVEVHPRIPSVSNKMKSVTTSHDGQSKAVVQFVKKFLGLNHNLFSVGHFCDADLEVAFRKSTCFVRDLQGNDLLTDNRRSDLYTISLQESTSSTSLCLMAKASPTQAWLWHPRLSHLNFDYLNLLSKKDIVIGLPKLKYVKNQLCFSCELSKAKRSSFKLNDAPSSKGRLNLLHMDLCGPMRVASINGKKYILVIVDDYSRYTWTLFLRSKDETPEVLKEFLTMIQRNLQESVITVRTDKGTEFLNNTLNAFFKEEGIEHQTSTARTPEQNDVVER
nr:retrovirus-related Pol polyprotein from transposon TNT 1-94 [Tanacetum cinerariifolium]